MDMPEEQNATDTSLALERLRLEREALAVERERLATARAHAQAEAKLAKSSHHPVLLAICVLLLTALAFAGGLFSGISLMETRQQRLREERLARALSQLDVLSTPDATGTNAAALPAGMQTQSPDGAHRNVSVMVIQ